MRKTCFLCGVVLTETMQEYTDYTNLCPECAMDAEDFGIDDEDLDEYYKVV